MEQNRAIENETHSGSGNHIPWLEWLASGLGFLLALCVFGFIGWQALHDATSSPAIMVAATETSQVAGGYRVIFEARNVGGAAAAQVRIEGTISGGSGPETSSVILDYIPGHSARKGGLFFTQNPQSGHLSLRAAGFAKP
ncbi:hypothetical protein [Microvirga sp. VF16]|uniref:hypothetical protein n=1 Tax=Microvirga sp. VF16 TaxID=2807101 RepID=UPI00193CFF00|nr:hypothetical protein [Microvirga sp. VF16]QRM30253.1 hypothetical protein JO965_04350 [Microvirga sp. VF16]